MSRTTLLILLVTFSIPLSISMISIIPSVQYQHAAAQQNGSSITLGNPIFIENDQATPPSPAVLNGTHGLQTSYVGCGVVKGMKF